MKNYIAALVLIILTSCNQKETNYQNDFETVKDSLKTVYAPDTRVEIFDINLNKRDKTLTITGETTNPEVVSVFNDKLTPLIDKNGNLIGVNTLKMTEASRKGRGDGFGIAIPITDVFDEFGAFFGVSKKAVVKPEA